MQHNEYLCVHNKVSHPLERVLLFRFPGALTDRMINAAKFNFLKNEILDLALAYLSYSCSI